MKNLLLLLFVVLLSASLQAQSKRDSIAGLFTAADGTKLYYEVKGTGSPVLLVHGFIVNSESWKRTALYTSLLNEGYQVILVDLRGNGRSDKPHTAEAYADDAEAKDIMALMSSLRVERYHAVGYSRGSIIVSRLLVSDKRVVAGVMGGMGSAFTDPLWPRRVLFYEALMGKEVKELEGMVRYVKESGLDQEALAYLQKEQPSTSKSEFARVRQPVLIICGTEDRDNGSPESLAGLIPHSTYKAIPGNHNNASRSTEFAEGVMSFLKKIK